MSNSTIYYSITQLRHRILCRYICASALMRNPPRRGCRHR